MGENLGQNQGIGQCRQEIETRSREDKPQLHYELHEHTFHGEFWRNKRNCAKIHYQPIPQRKILLRQASRNLWRSHIKAYWSLKPR